MRFNVEKNNGNMTIELEGWLDTNTAPDLDRFLHDSLDGIRSLKFDLRLLEYISSAGLRVLLYAHKKVTGQKGNMKVTGCSEDIMEIFEITGFSDILNIE